MSYNIINDFTDDKNATYISTDPYWVVAIYPLVYPVTYKRANKGSFDKDISLGVKTDHPLILVDEVQSIQVNSTKSNHVGNMSTVLFPYREFLTLVNPGDYIFAWIVNGKRSLDDVVKALKEGRPANKFSSGLKFYGKVNSVREQIQQSPDGHRQARFLVNANSFTELDATFFYEQHLATLKEGVATQLKQLNLEMDKLFDTKDGEIGFIPNQMIVQLIDVFLGKGVKKNLDSGATEAELKSTFGAEGDYAHIVPDVVGGVLNKTISSGGVQKTADILEVVHGLQHYGQSSNDGLKNTNTDYKGIAQSFAPDGTLQSDSRRFTGENLLGRNSPIPPALSNHSLWSVLNEYLNPAVNELYATLRCNPDGDIVPTVICRQMPFTTDAYDGTTPVTYFQEVPRWVVPPVIVRNVDIGRSDALRFNFVHVYGVSDTASARNITQQMVDAPPQVDEMDIARSGLRPYMSTVPCWVDETRESQGPKKWMEVNADYIMGQHMTLTGILTIVGVQSPICVGDNLEWDKNVYHIEAVSHSCNITSDGSKHSETTLSLTHGLAIDRFVSGADTDQELYARSNSSRKESTFLPLLTIETEKK